jgi:hypothetical protein
MSAVGPKGALQPSAYRVGAAVLPCRILKRGADVNHVIHATAVSSVPVGISEEGQATVDKPVRVAHRPGELVRVEAGAAIAIDTAVTSDATGRAVAAVSTNQSVGITRDAALAAGDLVTVEIRYGIVP